MLEISNKTNLLEQNIYKYSLQDVEEPNLYSLIMRRFPKLHSTTEGCL